MQQRASLITLGVRDLQRARAFYDGLGWTCASEEQSAEVVAYDLGGGMCLGLFPRDKLAEDAGVTFTDGPHPAVTLAYNVSTDADVDAILAEAAASGGKLVKAADKTFWGGYSGYFADPDGVLWEVAHNPFSKLGPDGAFRWNGYP
jgi:hypothetical protein